MKQISSLFTIIVTSVVVFVLLSFGLPTTPAAAFQSTAVQSTSPIGNTLPAVQPAPICDASRSVQVSGTAVINVTPDRALIQLGVQSNGATPGMVEGINSAATQAVIKAIRAMGIDGQDIATDLYVIEPVYASYDTVSIKGYRINNIVAITLRDVSKTSKLIAAALQAGANQVINVDLYTSDLRKYRDQAREMAMQAAHEKAQALANAAGAEAGCVLSINENSWSAYNGWWNGGSSTAGDEPISLGQISVKAEINASFGLK